ncbi:MAG: hypothetical protein MN733_38390 [Nitrososphaera sp.]|nr:hypothetical protein [Nitrososphaera sp.]
MEEPLFGQQKEANALLLLQAYKVNCEGRGNEALVSLWNSPFLGSLNYLVLCQKINARVWKPLLSYLRRLEARFGYFLPYSVSEMKNDEFFKAIEYLAREEPVKNALLIGAATNEGCTKAFLKGIRENRSQSSVFCVNRSTRRFRKLQKFSRNDPVIKCYTLSFSCRETFCREIGRIIKRIKEDNQIEHFDLGNLCKTPRSDR